MAPFEAQLLEGRIVVLRWTDAEAMNKLLDPISDRVDGPIKNRLGHNFSWAEMTPNEAKALMGMLPKSMGKSFTYLIACMKGNAQTLKHELCHAQYYVSQEWQELVNHVWSDVLSDRDRTYLTSFLTRLKYKPSVHIDEFQAYALTEPANFWGIQIDEALEALQPLRELLSSSK
jgi:hypothetical protein